MPIAADPFAPPRTIGQGLTGIVGPGYGPATGGAAEADTPPGVGPFGAGGPLSAQADQAREGLSQLLQASRPGSTPIDTSSMGLPMSSLGIPRLGGSPVSTGGLASIANAPMISGSGVGPLADQFAGGSVGGEAPGSPGGPTAASEGGRANLGSALGLGSLAGTGLRGGALAAAMLGAPGLAGILGPAGSVFGGMLTFSNAMDALADALGMPSNFTGFTPSGEQIQGQNLNGGLFGPGGLLGPGFGTRGESLPMSEAARSGFGEEGPAPAGPGPSSDTPGGQAGAETGGGTGGTGGTGDGGGNASDAMHHGGLVADRGMPGGEERHQLLPGEFVIQAPAVKKLGLARLMRENQVA